MTEGVDLVGLVVMLILEFIANNPDTNMNQIVHTLGLVPPNTSHGTRAIKILITHFKTASILKNNDGSRLILIHPNKYTSENANKVIHGKFQKAYVKLKRIIFDSLPTQNAKTMRDKLSIAKEYQCIIRMVMMTLTVRRVTEKRLHGIRKLVCGVYDSRTENVLSESISFCPPKSGKSGHERRTGSVLGKRKREFDEEVYAETLSDDCSHVHKKRRYDFTVKLVISIDGVVYILIYIIEVDGSGHFYFIKKWHKNIKNFKRLQQVDIWKEIYAYMNGIPVMRIDQKVAGDERHIDTCVKDFENYLKDLHTSDNKENVIPCIIKYGDEYKENDEEKIIRKKHILTPTGTPIQVTNCRPSLTCKPIRMSKFKLPR